jgi:carbon-monoxide dehydrogenase large subunit
MVQAPERLIGAEVKRKEDPRLITGRGTYVDNLKFAGTVYLAILRSPYAHARIKRIDTSRARAHPKVLAVFTGEDLRRDGIGSIPVGWLLPDIKLPPHYPLAVDKVRYVGDGVAAVVAEDRYSAHDALGLIDVEYEPLPAVVDQEAATRPGAPQLHNEAPNNICFKFAMSAGDVDRAFAEADGVVRQRIVNHRTSGSSVEPRAAVALYQPATGELTLYNTNQNPHLIRLLLALTMNYPEHKIRVIAPDVGGGFGTKIYLYPDEVVACYAAMKLGRPVKWVETRSEYLRATVHGRDHITDFEAAYKRDGTITGLKVATYANLGAYISPFAPLIPSFLYVPMLHGPYRLPNVSAEVYGVFTNTTPVDATRGAGRPEATYLLERMVDLVARELNLDPAEVRRKNVLEPFENYQTPLAFVYDSGNYPATLNRALELVGYAQLREEQRRLREQGRYIGIGLSTYVEVTGAAPSQIAVSLGAQAGLFESAIVRVHPTGKVTVFTGSHTHGQGHETTFAQAIADQLGIPLVDVEVVHGDTDAIPFGLGTYGSRSTPVGLSAAYVAGQRIIEKAKRIAAHLLEAAEADIVFEGGRFFVRGAPERAVTFQEVALEAYVPRKIPADLELGLEATAFFNPSNFVFPFGTHVAVVEVDPETGQVKLLRYVAVDDVGRVINPMIVDGQVHGGVVHGVGQALWEQVVYDEQGNLLTGTWLDYAMPRAADLPFFQTDRLETPSPVNPLGVKGAGETGTIASTPAVVNAVLDALAPFGVKHIDMPLTPERVWRAVRAAQGQG